MHHISEKPPSVRPVAYEFPGRRSCASLRRIDEFWDGSVAGDGTGEFVTLSTES